MPRPNVAFAAVFQVDIGTGQNGGPTSTLKLLTWRWRSIGGGEFCPGGEGRQLESCSQRESAPETLLQWQLKAEFVMVTLMDVDMQGLIKGRHSPRTNVSLAPCCGTSAKLFSLSNFLVKRCSPQRSHGAWSDPRFDPDTTDRNCEGFMLGPCITCKLGCLD